MTTDELDAILTHAKVGNSRLERTELAAVCHGVSTVPAAEFIEAVTQAPGLSWDDGQTRPTNYLEIHSRHWWIDVSDASNRQHLLTVATAAVLVDVLRLSFSTGWVTRVLSAVLAIRSVSRDEDGLHLDLVRRGAAVIPPDLMASVHPDDFAGFVKAVDGAPAVLHLPGGGTITFTGPA